MKLKKLNFLGSALYVAAHPDDENTRVIAYLANERLAATAYLSMTRGDGGQNLIGPEMRDLLGLIRTQELITARKIDGGEQFFTRANDFGYSKSADETFETWNKDEILSDVVRVYRSFQPDVILTRFPPNERAGHGHHTASAMLAIEAFDVSGKATTYPNQLKTFTTWQPKRLYINTGRWWNDTINENTPGVTALDVGGYNTLLGESYAEMAAASRSQHKSQGFGASGRRGEAKEFFELTRGDAARDIFDGVNTTWSRVKGGEKVQPLVDRAIREFDLEAPYKSIPILMQIRNVIRQVEPGVWRNRKLKETDLLIKDCLGFYAEVVAGTFHGSPGEVVTLNYELINRSAFPVTLKRITCGDVALDTMFQQKLENNIPLSFRVQKKIDSKKEYSDPYWLREPHSIGLFTVPDEKLIGKPENDAALTMVVEILVDKEPVHIHVPVVYKWTDPVKGEQNRPFEIVPAVFVNLSDPVLVFSDATPKTIQVQIKSAVSKAISGTLKLNLPQGWQTEPADASLTISARGEEVVHDFLVYPGNEEVTGKLSATFKVGDKIFNQSLQLISYDHIPVQTLLPKAETKVVRINLKREGNTVGYIRGAGDDIPVALRTMGYEMVDLKNSDVTIENLKRMDAVVLGVRAINTNERLRFLMPALLEYVKQGGTLVMQYNTSVELGTTFTPYKLNISRDRVTDENSEVRFLLPNHPVLNYPNKITTNDFKDWVQERGLYFPNTWASEFEAILSMNDKGEDPKDGSLLVAKYGNGYYIYTGLSFFRELPEGVAGAYKLFANLVSVSKQPLQGVIPKKNLKKSKRK
ncbi:MAG: PIG-L family deacetylase [Cyclobacteriaceae bacterium]|nr:PIG-L family deacetylase [Cyclobacteriaceae bacterium]